MVEEICIEQRKKQLLDKFKDELGPEILGMLKDRPAEMQRKLYYVKDTISQCSNNNLSHQELEETFDALFEHVPEAIDCYGMQAINDLIMSA